MRMFARCGSHTHTNTHTTAALVLTHKPQAGNVLVAGDGHVALGDFGVSATMERGGEWGGSGLVSRNTFVGTPCCEFRAACCLWGGCALDAVCGKVAVTCVGTGQAEGNLLNASCLSSSCLF